MLLSIIEQSCVFLPLILGIYISYGVLRIADLTTDGTFILGAALFAIFIKWDLNPCLATCSSLLGGMVAGLVVSLLQTRLHLQPLIAGILLVFILNSITLKMMGRPNISLFDSPSIFFSYPKLAILIPLGILLLLSTAGLLASRLGLMLHAFGNHPPLVHLCGKNGNSFRMFGLSLSNGLVAFSGALTAQINGYADIGMGVGMVLIALGIVIIGQQIYKSLFQTLPFPLLQRLICCFLGGALYFSTVYALLALGLDPIYLRLMIGISLIAFLAMTQKKVTQRAAL